jgi:TonB family protein
MGHGAVIATLPGKFLRPHWGKVAVGIVVLLTHAAVLDLLPSSRSVQHVESEERRIAVTWVQAAEMEGRDTSPLPEIQLVTPVPNFNAVSEVQFEDLDDQAAVIGSSSAPRLLRVQPVSLETYARRAGILPRQPATVVLAILVQENGEVGDVRVVRGSGSDAIDAAAVEYAKALHWIAGTQNREPRSMRITFPVTLSVSDLR